MSFIFCLVLDISKITENTIQKENIIFKGNGKQDTTIVLKNDIYKLELKTIILDDILTNKWVEYGFLSPLILNQYLFFYKNGEMIKKYEIPTERVTKKTNRHKKVALISVPVFDICLLKGDSIEVYKVYGANYCNGMCPEFFGLYSMTGEMISESIAVRKYFSGSDISHFLARHQIDINNPVICISIFDIFTIEE
jgi:hypothetical protein